jgi:hypothetical protein
LKGGTSFAKVGNFLHLVLSEEHFRHHVLLRNYRVQQRRDNLKKKNDSRRGIDLLLGVVVDDLIVEVEVGVGDVLVSVGACLGHRCRPWNWMVPAATNRKTIVLYQTDVKSVLHHDCPREQSKHKWAQDFYLPNDRTKVAILAKEQRRFVVDVVLRQTKQISHT